MSLIGKLHHELIHRRRVSVLSSLFQNEIPPRATVLDIGCGDGLVAKSLVDAQPGIKVIGVDTVVRKRTHIPVQPYDGSTLPFADGSFDVCILTDVVHHAESPEALLKEAIRVSKKRILIKDHLLKGFLAEATLRWMDRVGNGDYDIAPPGEYWEEERWRSIFERLNLNLLRWDNRLGLYVSPLGLLFERGLHFVATLDKGSERAEPKLSH